MVPAAVMPSVFFSEKGTFQNKSSNSPL